MIRENIIFLKSYQALFLKILLLKSYIDFNLHRLLIDNCVKVSEQLPKGNVYHFSKMGNLSSCLLSKSGKMLTVLILALNNYGTT